jgi:predicted esterase
MAKKAKKVEDIIKDVEKLDAPAEEKAEAIKELEDLLDAPSRKAIFIGYHPITGEEVWQ